MKIISGGQTGVDRGALDAALAEGVECGGWCPADRTAEDGPLPMQYPVTPLAKGGLVARARMNVVDSDGTAIIYFGVPSGGTEGTLRQCLKKRRPYKLIDADEVLPDRAAQLLGAFIEQHGIRVLNVAGPRASKERRGHDFAFRCIRSLLSDTRDA